MAANISNSVRTVRGGEGTAVSIGALIALNRINSDVIAELVGGASIVIGGKLDIESSNAAIITSTVVQPVIAIQYNVFSKDSGTAVTISLVFARDVSDGDVIAQISDSVNLTAAAVTVNAKQKSSKHAASPIGP